MSNYFLTSFEKNATMSPIDIARALQSLEGNEELLKDLASMFVEDAPVLLDQLKIALSDNDSLQARTAVHSLKGLVSTFYATKGVEIAQRLEDYAALGDLAEFRNGELEILEECVNSVSADFRSRGWVDRI
jgi:HPt (histidine-containing phosphotransfer) domain-containing protein